MPSGKHTGSNKKWERAIVLADAVGVTRQTISSIEKSKFVPSALLAMKIARYFGKTVEEIFFIREDAEGDRE